MECQGSGKMIPNDATAYALGVMLLSFPDSCELNLSLSYPCLALSKLLLLHEIYIRVKPSSAADYD